MNTIQIRKATKTKSKLRIGLAGTSGSGKTYSALLLASGLTDWSKICVIDTENGSADLYDSLGEYNVITLTAPFSPERYIEAIKAAENAGMEVIVVDSITHEWDGQGGCLEIVEQVTKASTSKNSYTAWAKVTPRHNAFVQALLQSSCHIITTVRRKQDYDMSKDSNNRTVVTKVGMKEVTRDGFEYELTLSFALSQNHLAEASKDRTGLFMNKPEFVITKETGLTLKNWAESGKEPSIIQPSIEKDPTDEWPDKPEMVTEEREGMMVTHPKDMTGYGCADCGESVTMKVRAYSKDKHGKVLCFNCQKKQPNKVH